MRKVSIYVVNMLSMKKNYDKFFVENYMINIFHNDYLFKKIHIFEDKAENTAEGILQSSKA